MSLVENVEFRIMKENWSGNGTWIYRIQPTNTQIYKLKKHPIYKTYSIISNKEFMIGQVVTADLKPRPGKNGATDYIFVRETITFPKDPSAQWDFLHRIAGNHSFKRVHKAFLSTLDPNTLVLDFIMQQTTPPKFLDEKLHNSYNKLRETIEKYKKNSTFIENIPAEVAELLTDATIDKLSELGSTSEMSAKIFLEQPFMAITIEGLGFKTLDKIRAKLEKAFPDNPNYAHNNNVRIYFGAYDIIDRDVIRSGNTYITADALRDQMIEDLKLPIDMVNHFIDHGHSNQPMINGNTIYKYHDVFTTGLLYQSEKLTFQFLSRENKVTPDPLLISATERYIEESGLKFSPEQLSFLRSVHSHRINILSGGGGTGKTWLISKLIDIYESVYRKSTLLTAPTGKAAHVLSVYTNKNAQTIHNAFNILPGNNELHAYLTDVYKLIVFDESSMIDSTIMGNIISAIENNSLMDDVRLVFIGDPYQLPSVGPGNILHNFLRYNVANITTLTEVFRVGDTDGGISSISKDFREGRFPYRGAKNAEAIGGDLVIENLEDDQDIHDRVVTAYYRLLSKDGAYPEDIMVLSPQNKGLTGQAQLNISIQEVVRTYFGREDVSYLSRNIFGVEMDFYPDDIVMFNKNAKLTQMNFLSERGNNFEVDRARMETTTVNNGDLGIIDAADDEGMIVSLIGKEKSVYVSKSDLNDVTLGYAFTIHKSQGSQSAYGIMAIAPKDYYSLNANLLYTGASRFINKLYLFGSYRTIRGKVKQFVNISRNTLLEEWLIEWRNKDVVF